MKKALRSECFCFVIIKNEDELTEHLQKVKFSSHHSSSHRISQGNSSVNNDFRIHVKQQFQSKNPVKINTKSIKLSEGDTPLLPRYENTALDKNIIPDTPYLIKKI